METTKRLIRYKEKLTETLLDKVRILKGKEPFL